MFSSHTQVLAKLAVHLFDARQPVVPLDLVNQLDEQRVQLAINALILRRMGFYEPSVIFFVPGASRDL